MKLNPQPRIEKACTHFEEEESPNKEKKKKKKGKNEKKQKKGNVSAKRSSPHLTDLIRSGKRLKVRARRILQSKSDEVKDASRKKENEENVITSPIIVAESFVS